MGNLLNAAVWKRTEGRKDEFNTKIDNWFRRWREQV